MFCSQLPHIKQLSLSVASPLRCDFWIFLNHPVAVPPNDPGKRETLTRNGRLWIFVGPIFWQKPTSYVLQAFHERVSVSPLASSLISLSIQSLFRQSLQLDVDLRNRIWSFRKSSRKSFWNWRSRPAARRLDKGQTEDRDMNMQRCRKGRLEVSLRLGRLGRRGP